MLTPGAERRVIFALLALEIKKEEIIQPSKQPGTSIS
jgi:hypothetical protein